MDQLLRNPMLISLKLEKSSAVATLEGENTARKLNWRSSMTDSGMALATALNESVSLQSFQLDWSDTDIGDDAGTALATALQENSSLRSFQLNCSETMGDDTGTALATALQENSSLQSFQLNCSTSMGDDTGTALATALQENSSLQSFQLNCSTSMGDDTGTALATALQENTSLRVFECNECNWHLPIAESLLRNCQLPVHWLAATCFARHAASRACLGMPEEDFRRSIFGFFLPDGAAERLAARAATRRADARPTTGDPGDSREAHEVIQAIESVVMDSIEHADPPTMIDDQEASAISDVQHAGFIERNISFMADQATCYVDDDIEEPIFLCKLNRQPAELRNALSEGSPLRSCRDALEAAGHPWKHFSGAFIFVHPWQFRYALQALNHVELKADHIVVAASVEYLVAETMARCKGVWMKARDELQGSSAVASASDELGIASTVSEDSAAGEQTGPIDQFQIVVERTFICVVPIREGESAVTASTTDAHSCRANPRRSAAALFDQ